VTTKLVLSADAQRDLEGIRKYTERNWGIEQARQYRAQLRACAARLVAKPGAGKDLAAVMPGLRAIRCQHHYIFCAFSPADPPLIIAILHERMDLLARIAERL
jgi:toxin ParE1/3/4